MDNQAIHPSATALKVIRDMQKDQDEPGIDPGDAKLTELAQMPGWKDLKEYINNRKVALKPQLDTSLKSDDELFKSYGMRMMIYDIVSSALDDIINRVENAKEEVEKVRK